MQLLWIFSNSNNIKNIYAGSNMHAAPTLNKLHLNQMLLVTINMLLGGLDFWPLFLAEFNANVQPNECQTNSFYAGKKRLQYYL